MNSYGKWSNWASFLLLPVTAFFLWAFINWIILNPFVFSGSFFKDPQNMWLVPAIRLSLFVFVVWSGISGARVSAFSQENPEGTGETWHFAVPTGYGAILTITNMRLGPLFSVVEGPFWWFPYPLGIAKLVDLREFGVTISEQTVPTEDTVDVGIEIEIRAQITDPYHFIGQEGIFRPGTEDGSYEKLAHSVLRAYVQGKKVNDLISSVRSEDLTNALMNGLEPSSEAWGIETRRIFYRDLNLPEVITQAAARVPTEERNRLADRIKRENLVENAIQIAIELGMTRKDAALMFQAEQGDMNVTQRRVVIDGVDDILKIVRENAPTLAEAFLERLRGGRRIIT